MRFNLNDYETVESRIKRFYEEYPDGRIVTKLIEDFNMKDGPVTWKFRATVYLSAGDQANKLPKATGYASEIDGTGGANNGSAAENAETSAIGRALANMGLSGNKRASREEMQKVEAIQQRDWLKDADKIISVDAMRWLYSQAEKAGASKEVLEGIQERGRILSAESEGSGAGGSVPPVSKQKPAK